MRYLDSALGSHATGFQCTPKFDRESNEGYLYRQAAIMGGAVWELPGLLYLRPPSSGRDIARLNPQAWLRALAASNSPAFRRPSQVDGFRDAAGGRNVFDWARRPAGVRDGLILKPSSPTNVHMYHYWIACRRPEWNRSRAGDIARDEAMEQIQAQFTTARALNQERLDDLEVPIPGINLPAIGKSIEGTAKIFKTVAIVGASAIGLSLLLRLNR